MRTLLKLGKLARLLAAALGLLVAGVAPPAHAGSAVASDDHGEYGYAYGDDSAESLRREAIRRCREKSTFPEDVRIIVETVKNGAGIIVRYHAEGVQHVYAYVGAQSERQAYDYATGYVEGYGGHQIEVVARWQDGK